MQSLTFKLKRDLLIKRRAVHSLADVFGEAADASIWIPADNLLFYFLRRFTFMATRESVGKRQPSFPLFALARTLDPVK